MGTHYKIGGGVSGKMGHPFWIQSSGKQEVLTIVTAELILFLNWREANVIPCKASGG